MTEERFKETLTLDITAPQRPPYPDRTGNPEKDKALQDAWNKAMEEHRIALGESRAQALATCNHRLEDRETPFGVIPGKGESICYEICDREPAENMHETEVDPYLCCVPVFQSRGATENSPAQEDDETKSGGAEDKPS